MVISRHRLILAIAVSLLVIGLIFVLNSDGTGTQGEREGEVVFHGEGEAWQALIIEESAQALSEDGGDGAEEENYTTVSRILKYKGEDIEGVGEVNYYIDGDRGKSSGFNTPDDRGKIVLPVIEGSFSVAEKTDRWHVTVRWDGNVERFELRAK